MVSHLFDKCAHILTVNLTHYNAFKHPSNTYTLIMCLQKRKKNCYCDLAENVRNGFPESVYRKNMAHITNSL